MFSDLVESVTVGKATNKRWGFAVSLAFQAACLLTLILIPLIYTQALPKAIMNTFLVAPSPPRPASPAPRAEIADERTARSPHVLRPDVLTQPIVPSKHAELSPEAPPSAQSDIQFGVVGGDGGGEVPDIFADDARRQTPAAPVPPPALPPEPAPPHRIVLGGVIEEAKLITRVQPIYPALALQTHTQGAVVLHAVIDKEGRVSELHVLSGHPLLVKAAMGAVNQWRYQPTLLNGQPVEVETTITVSFVLGG